jgi:hypothetical protein
MEILQHRKGTVDSSYSACARMHDHFSGKVEAQLHFFRLPGFPTRYTALLVCYPTTNVFRDGIVAHELTGEPAQLEWWQRDHLLCGFGIATTMAAAADQAVCAMERGELERLQLTVWWDRFTHKHRFFRRSPRQDGNRYLPSGDEITGATLRALLAR